MLVSRFVVARLQMFSHEAAIDSVIRGHLNLRRMICLSHCSHPAPVEGETQWNDSRSVWSRLIQLTLRDEMSWSEDDESTDWLRSVDSSDRRPIRGIDFDCAFVKNWPLTGSKENKETTSESETITKSDLNMMMNGKVVSSVSWVKWIKGSPDAALNRKNISRCSHF